MNSLRKIKEKISSSIRYQIIALIVIISFFVAFLLATVFYVRARKISLSQMEESYKSLVTMIASSSAYDIQFNRKAIPELAKKIADSDRNILLVEFTSANGEIIAISGPLNKSLSEEGIENKESCRKACHIKGSEKPEKSEMVLSVKSRSKGKALLAVGVIKVLAKEEAISPEFGFEAVSPTKGKENYLGEVRILISLQALSELQQSYFLLGLILVILATFLGGIFAYGFSNYLTQSFRTPIELAKKISEGDLTEFKVSFEVKGELGELFSAFKNMSLQLASVIRRIRDAFNKVETDTRSVRQQLLKTMENTEKQTQATSLVINNITQIEKSIKEVAAHMEDLAGLAEEVSSSVLEMIASIEEIAKSADGLTESVNASASTLAQNTTAVKEIDASADQIHRFVEDTSTAMIEMESSIRQIEQNSLSMRQAVESASHEAQSGVEVVGHSASTISELQGSFLSVKEAMKSLGKRSEEIGNILSVIDDVMEQTHLLALNAAIIAAQAGEQGKAFSVVAGEIRSLAEKTSVSTREIATLIDSVQQEVNRAIDLVNSQSSLVEETVKSSEATASSFKRIYSSLTPAVMMTQEINRAIQEQSKGTQSILKSVEQLRNLAFQLTRATKEQSLGSEQILKEVNRIRNLAEEVKRATKEQSIGSSLIRKAMDKLTSATSSVLKLTKEQKIAAEAVEESIKTFRKISEENSMLIKEASEKVEVLTKRAEEAGREVGHFKVGQ